MTARWLDSRVWIGVGGDECSLSITWNGAIDPEHPAYREFMERAHRRLERKVWAEMNAVSILAPERVRGAAGRSTDERAW